MPCFVNWAAFVLEVFTHPPTSTQQILHPELYLAHHAPPIRLLRACGSARLRTLADGNLGEFDYRVLLSQYSSDDEGKAAAAHLAGVPMLCLNISMTNSRCSSMHPPGIRSNPRVNIRPVRQGPARQVEDRRIRIPDTFRLAGHGDSGYFRTGWMAQRSTISRLESQLSVAQASSLRTGSKTQISATLKNKELFGCFDSSGWRRVACSFALQAEVPPAPRPAPEFTIKYADGKPGSVEQSQGEVVALTFIFTTCVHCQHASQVFFETLHRIRSRDFNRWRRY